MHGVYTCIRRCTYGNGIIKRKGYKRYNINGIQAYRRTSFILQIEFRIRGRSLAFSSTSWTRPFRPAISIAALASGSATSSECTGVIHVIHVIHAIHAIRVGHVGLYIGRERVRE